MVCEVLGFSLRGDSAPTTPVLNVSKGKGFPMNGTGSAEARRPRPGRSPAWRLWLAGAAAIGSSAVSSAVLVTACWSERNGGIT